ncbi:Uncharacterised protein [Sphingobacterium thalpophilum]|uniref:Uncharacterized protein n=2 Tax=Sphingobacterium thalpophilum TaxID=259 RepID=A0A4U9UBU3_9SPHI|nr:Uncharacterised protein [Sphingobacterium thalpophilum]
MGLQKNHKTMLFIYSIYDFVLAEKKITTTLKQENESRNFTLQIITPARKFIGMPFGGGMVKISRLYDEHGKLIHARRYSDELKAEIKSFKKEHAIPYFQLWKGFLLVFAGILIWAAIYGVKNKMANQQRKQETVRLFEQLQHLSAGQLYAATFFTNSNAEGIDGVPAGWIKINKIAGDTLFVQRSKKLDTEHALFDMAHMASIKPQAVSDWNEKIEKIDLKLLRDQLQETNKKSVDLIYIGPDHDKYSGVICTVKGSE